MFIEVTFMRSCTSKADSDILKRVGRERTYDTVWMNEGKNSYDDENLFMSYFPHWKFWLGLKTMLKNRSLISISEEF